MELSKRTLKQIKNLENVIDFDMEKRIASIPLHFRSSEEILDEVLSKPGYPVVSDEITSYLHTICESIPKEFYVELVLKIDDCGDYTHNELLTSLKIEIENEYYYYDEHKKKDNYLSVLFIIIGLIVIAFSFVWKDIEWLNILITGDATNISTDIFESILEIISWVFIWEGGAILFLTYDHDFTAFKNNLRRLSGIRIVDRNNCTLCESTDEEIYSNWVSIGKGELFARNVILIINTVYLAIGSIVLVELVAKHDSFSTTQIVWLSLDMLLLLLFAFSNLSFYREKGFLRHFAIFASITQFVTTFLYLASEAANIFQSSIALIIPMVAMGVLSLLNLLCLLYMRKQHVDITE